MAHVLVVEDDLATRLFFSALLTRCDITCTAVGDGASALAAMARHEFDGVLLDLILPRLSGFDVLKTVRQTNPDLVSRVVVCSALSPHELERSPDLDGVSCVVRKPADLDELTRAIFKATARIPA